VGGLACVTHYLGGAIPKAMYNAAQVISNEVETVRREAYD